MDSDIQRVKQRHGIIGNSDGLNRAINIAMQVAPTDMSVLITGESGTGKETFPKIIHENSIRKHAKYIAVNCGAIPEGTIDSELFGHEKGAFTGAHDSRKGYFEVADKGTIFLDEVAELPLSTQVRLLRVLESGEFIRVGSSKVQKTDVRVVAATNVNVEDAVREGKFREDLYYRLNTVPIIIPPLRERNDDIWFLFRKFSSDITDKYGMPPLDISDEAMRMLENYRWPGNIRQLKNITEQMAVIERDQYITPEIVRRYLPEVDVSRLPALAKKEESQSFASEREILYKVLFDMKKDMSDLKRLVYDLMENGVDEASNKEENTQILRDLHAQKTNLPSEMPEKYLNKGSEISTPHAQPQEGLYTDKEEDHKDLIEDTEEYVEESLSLADKEKELITKALDKHKGRRKLAAKDLGISERTLYRKIKEYDIDA
ncbi:Nif-specific regulatory protein [Salinivirga cyanobacteriivorans]|uniref:Nif-specific regulatory protein n=1 Tax=Salinivirga cyanobacteriivorans TaxID=1307839 RepID=A0A0S2I079_9BACT|nr:sigma-54 dependent transcriptional regulator [Salinivirga cyanobacteriivorans]ALO15677.1 Nif-specific regulatory protein [Salinivirga cyanobacteriivorans]